MQVSKQKVLLFLRWNFQGVQDVLLRLYRVGFFFVHVLIYFF